MGGGSEDSITRKQNAAQIQTKTKLKILMLIVLTNLLTIYIFTGPYQNSTFSNYPISSTSTSILIQTLNSTQEELISSQSQITQLRNDLKLSHAQIEELINELSQLNTAITSNNNNNNQEEEASSSKSTHLTYNDLLTDISDEAKLAIGPHKLPLGYNPRTESDEIHFSVGGGCLNHKQDLLKYMSYQIGAECPVDDALSQTLMMKGCEPLPRRRCHPKSPLNYTDPTPLPASLWSIPPDSSIIWEPYTCKNYTCLTERRKSPGIYDCKDCFELDGREKTRWLNDGGLDYGIDQVLSAKKKGTIRVGLDIGGGSGTFAARMRERDVTIVTTSMNFDGPFNSFIASRGLIAMHVTVSQRFPFFENTLDIVHSMHVLSNWIPDEMLEFTLYDVYRVLRPGGLFWLDRFFCFGEQLNATYVPMFERVGFRKLRWNTGRKVDRGIDKNEWYFSALLEKPMT